MDCRDSLQRAVEEFRHVRQQQKQAFGDLQKKLQDSFTAEEERATRLIHDVDAIEDCILSRDREQEIRLKALEDAQRNDKSLRAKLARVQSAEINRLESQQYEYETMMTDRYAELEKDHQHLIAQYNEFLKRIAEFSIEMKNAIAFGLWDSETAPQAALQEFKKAQKDKKADEKTWKHRQQLRLEVFNGRLLALEQS